MLAENLKDLDGLESERHWKLVQFSFECEIHPLTVYVLYTFMQ